MKSLEREYSRRYLDAVRERLTPLSTAGRRLNSKYGAHHSASNNVIINFIVDSGK